MPVPWGCPPSPTPASRGCPPSQAGGEGSGDSGTRARRQGGGKGSVALMWRRIRGWQVASTRCGGCCGSSAARGMLYTSSSIHRRRCSLHFRHDRLGVGAAECPLPSTSMVDYSMEGSVWMWAGLQRVDFPHTLVATSVILALFFCFEICASRGGRGKSTVEIANAATQACGLAFPVGGSIERHDTTRSVGRLVAVAASQ